MAQSVRWAEAGIYGSRTRIGGSVSPTTGPVQALGSSAPPVRIVAGVSRMAGDEQDQDSGGPGRLWSWIGEGVIASARGLALCALPLAAAGLVLALAAPLVFAGLGAGVGLNPPPGMPPGLRAAPFAGVAASLLLLLLPSSLLAMRRLANQARRLAGAWGGVPIAEPYRALPGDRKLSRRGRLGGAVGRPGAPGGWGR